jgi:hypothetical protein
VTRLTDLPLDRAKRLAEPECPGFVTGPALSILPAVALGVLVRGGVPADPRRNRAGGRAHSPPGVLLSSCSPAPADDPPQHNSVVKGQRLEREDSGPGRFAPPATMVRKDRRSGGFDADEVVSMRHVKTETPAVATSSVRTGSRLHPWPVRIMHWVNVVVMLIMITSGWGNLR